MPSRDSGVSDSGLPPGSPGTVVTVGTFDGVHLGHRDVLERITARAEELELRSVLVTFDPHPLRVINPEAAPPLLTVGSERLEVVAESGVDFMAIMPFTPTLQRYSAAQFVDEILIRRFHVRHLVIGHDHGFGRGREGDVEVLRRLGEERGFEVEVVEAVADADGRPISSTLIRRAVAGGDLRRAAEGLGRLYSVSGHVMEGDRRGRELGFPTLNVELPPPSSHKLLPPEGVYAVRVQTPSGPFGGMMNMGPRPTFGDAATSLEVHLFDASLDLYGAYVKVEFVSRLRDTRPFANAEALVAQLAADEENARTALTRLH
ncbi:MAG TPA: bifunctional riboflavin kinase/FAD synthetase [Gemmatimonadaceae bacterium]|nr:bifunctional riboflavin kinase/FAD synthetase [Gemmatimonadaceae bacterium]